MASTLLPELSGFKIHCPVCYSGDKSCTQKLQLQPSDLQHLNDSQYHYQWAITCKERTTKHQMCK